MHWKSDVAAFYVDSTYRYGVADSYYGAALALFDEGIQFDVLYSGDGRAVNNALSLSDLLKYKIVIMANPYAMTFHDINLIIDYVKSGGTVIAWGRLADGDEFCDWSIQWPSEWNYFKNIGLNPLAKGKLINISHDDIGTDYFKNRTGVTRNLITREIKNICSPEISSNAPENVNFLIYTDSSSDKIIVHIINYNYDINNDYINPVNSFSLRFKLPENFNISAKEAVLISPDFSEAISLSYNTDNNHIYVDIPPLDVYNILVISDWIYSPLNFRGEIKEIRSLVLSEYANILTWQADPRNKNASKYRIYEIINGDKILLSEVNSSELKYLHRKTDKNKEYKYWITTVNDKEQESVPSVTTVK